MVALNDKPYAADTKVKVLRNVQGYTTDSRLVPKSQTFTVKDVLKTGRTRDLRTTPSRAADPEKINLDLVGYELHFEKKVTENFSSKIEGVKNSEVSDDMVNKGNGSPPARPVKPGQKVFLKVDKGRFLKSTEGTVTVAGSKTGPGGNEVTGKLGTVTSATIAPRVVYTIEFFETREVSVQYWSNEYVSHKDLKLATV